MYWDDDAAHRIHRMDEGELFTSSDVIGAQREAGVQLPDERRAYGALMRKLQRAGLIEKAGVVQTDSRSHGGVTTLWRRA